MRLPTTHIVRLMAWLFSMLKPEERLLGSIDVLERGFGFIKLWKSYSYDDNNLQVSCSQDTHNLDGMWNFLENLYRPNPFSSDKKAGEAAKAMLEKAQVVGQKCFFSPPLCRRTHGL